jgi:hypothetical protein
MGVSQWLKPKLADTEGIFGIIEYLLLLIFPLFASFYFAVAL